MDSKRPVAAVASVLSVTSAVILAIMPFHAILTVWLASLSGHYMVVRLWKEYLLLIMLTGVCYLIYKDPKLRWRLISYKLHWLIAAYLAVQLLWGVVALMMHHVTTMALFYGWVVDLRFLAFFIVTGTAASYSRRLDKSWRPVVLWPALAVGLFALLQFFVLPYDFLRHLGYGPDTIFPYETINHNIQHLRVMSTLRGANPLGAYLVLVLSLAAVLSFKYRRLQAGLLLPIGLVALVLSFSRSAWLGLVVTAIVLGVALLKTRRSRRLASAAVTGLVIIAGLLVGLLHQTSGFQDTLFHTNDNSTIKVSSNQGHESAFRDGLRDALHQPLGRGPGTAGPASVYNNGHAPRIAENYFIQLAQETGWIGLLLFIAINVVVTRALWRRRQHSLALGLVAALAGISLINFLSHAWTDDTLAYLWWGLAGIAIAADLTAQDSGSEAVDPA